MKPSIPLLSMSVTRQSRSSIFLAISLAAFVPNGSAQVLSPAEIADPAIRSLQQSHLEELHAITGALSSHHFPYAFYFSRRLDISEREQVRSDQRSIQFDKFKGQIVLKITGNYFAAYSAERMSNQERAGRTYRDVMLPILQAAAPALAKSQVPDAFALEISHHVNRKVLGVDTESMENVVLILPKASAQRLIEANDETGRTAAILEGSAYLNGAPVSFWPGEVGKSPAIQASAAPVASQPSSGESNLQVEYRGTIAGMLKELDSEAHFVSYAPPAFISFRGGQYVQLPIMTTLALSDSGSQYKLAALAFDRHIVHLIRPVLACFKDSSDFTGIDFSTTVRLAGANAPGEGGEAVEFIFPLSALHDYAQFNLTGQQLLDAGIVLINGDRAGLDLQTAEADVARPPMMQPSGSAAIPHGIK